MRGASRLSWRAGLCGRRRCSGLDEDFIGTGLGDGDLFVDGVGAGFLDHLGPLGFWDGHDESGFRRE